MSRCANFNKTYTLTMLTTANNRKLIAPLAEYFLYLCMSVVFLVALICRTSTATSSGLIYSR